MSTITKTWVLTKPVTEFDVRFVSDIGCRITIENSEPIEFDIQGKTYRYTAPSPRRVSITSENEEQVTMLLLRFSPNIYLDSIEEMF